MGKVFRRLPGYIAVILLLSTWALGADSPYVLETIQSGLNRPYSLVFMPDGSMLMAEKSGRLRWYREPSGQSRDVCGVPAVYAEGQGGLQDVILHPRFAENHLIYLSYAEGSRRANATRVARATWQMGSDGSPCLSGLEAIFTATPEKTGPQHFGGRMVFLPDETLLLTVGEGYAYREKAQSLDNHLGKVIRIKNDGSVPIDNPFVGRAEALPEIWSYGHRNPQGLILDSSTGQVYEHEHGPKGGDEINLIEPGNNYGWPIATYGIDYSGAQISPYSAYPGTVQPLVYWVPSIAPAGFAQCHGCLWPQWEGNLFVGALAGRQVRRVVMDKGVVSSQQVMFTELNERIRDVRFGPDGALYLLTDNVQGRLLKVTPAQATALP